MTLFAKQVGSKKGFKKIATDKLASSDANWAAARDAGHRQLAG